MAAIITNKFRINNAEQFVESFSETANTTYYLFVGRSHSWASDVDAQGNTIAEGTDASPPTPNDDVSSEFYNYDDMLGAKLIASTDVTHCIPRRATLFPSRLTDSTSSVSEGKGSNHSEHGY